MKVGIVVIIFFPLYLVFLFFFLKKMKNSKGQNVKRE